MRSGRFRTLRSGVMANVKTRNRMVQSPVKWVMYSMGFAVRSLFQARQASQQTGTRHRTNSGILIQRWRSIGSSSLVVFLQVHAGVEARDLLPIAVEHDGG